MGKTLRPIDAAGRGNSVDGPCTPPLRCRGLRTPFVPIPPSVDELRNRAAPWISRRPAAGPRAKPIACPGARQRSRARGAGRLRRRDRRDRSLGHESRDAGPARDPLSITARRPSQRFDGCGPDPHSGRPGRRRSHPRPDRPGLGSSPRQPAAADRRSHRGQCPAWRAALAEGVGCRGGAKCDLERQRCIGRSRGGLYPDLRRHRLASRPLL